MMGRRFWLVWCVLFGLFDTASAIRYIAKGEMHWALILGLNAVVMACIFTFWWVRKPPSPESKLAQRIQDGTASDEDVVEMAMVLWQRPDRPADQTFPSLIEKLTVIRDRRR